MSSPIGFDTSNSFSAAYDAEGVAHESLRYRGGGPAPCSSSSSSAAAAAAAEEVLVQPEAEGRMHRVADALMAPWNKAVTWLRDPEAGLVKKIMAVVLAIVSLSFVWAPIGYGLKALAGRNENASVEEVDPLAENFNPSSLTKEEWNERWSCDDTVAKILKMPKSEAEAWNDQAKLAQWIDAYFCQMGDVYPFAIQTYHSNMRDYKNNLPQDNCRIIENIKFVGAAISRLPYVEEVKRAPQLKTNTERLLSVFERYLELRRMEIKELNPLREAMNPPATPKIELP